METVVRHSDEKFFPSITSAARDVQVTSGYLHYCIKNQKPCKGSYYSYCRDYIELYPAAKSRIEKQLRNQDITEEELREKREEEMEDSIQAILFTMKDEADKYDISLSEMYKEFIERTKDRFDE